MALAVALDEPLAVWASTPRVKSFASEAEKEKWKQTRKKLGKYQWAEHEIATVGADISPYEFKRQILIAPIPRFFMPWRPESGTPTPERLSRHVVAHQAAASHFTQENSLVAVMLTCSLLREQQEWCEEVRMMDNPG
jgi:hypothetical protein